MDRKSNYKIIYIVVIVFALLLSIGIFLFFNKRQEQINERYVREVTVIYPEMKQELVRSFEYYDKLRLNTIYKMGGCLTALFLIAAINLLWIKKAQDKIRWKKQKENMQQLIEIISEFGKGEYQVTRDSFSGMEENGEQWIQVSEALNRLGYQLSLLRERLEAEEDSTKRLITDISHQLKTPLASLKMSFELSRESNLSVEEQAEFIEKERQEIERLEGLLTELVNLSRLESRMIRVTPAEIEIQKLIAEAMNPVLMKATGKNITFKVEMPKNFTVHADMRWTSEAILNVLDNAIKYSEENSEITIGVQKLPQLALIEIADNGIGIAQEDLHKIFKRFYRGEEAMKKEREGAGVGLYLSRKILEEQGGTIIAKRRNDGTTFRITLPL